MRAIGIIPARYGATRFEGKVLANLCGKPVLQHVWERAKQSKALKDLIIACDDERILAKAKEFKAKAILTSKDHPSGSDRLIEAAKDLEADIIVNIQGDEPLIHHSIIDGLVKALKEDRSCMVATAIKAIDYEKELENPNIVKVVIDKDHYALYFSRSVIPFNRAKMATKTIGYYKHLGIYAYRRKFLMSFKGLPHSQLEQVEQLEQLRILQAGTKIKTVETDRPTAGIDVREDLFEAEKLLKREAENG
ncbi:MAG: 3-deoxy-manno-octulosonate cytidylyltransferase [Candidatus Omnitrophota bacterium]